MNGKKLKTLKKLWRMKNEEKNLNHKNSQEKCTKPTKFQRMTEEENKQTL